MINSIAWYTDAIKLTDTRLQKKTGNKNFLLINIDSFWKKTKGYNKTRPIKHLEKRRTKSDDPKSNEIFADEGTIAKHKDDNKTITIPKVFLSNNRKFPKN